MTRRERLSCLAFIVLATLLFGGCAAIGAYLLFVVAPRSPLDPPWGD